MSRCWDFAERPTPEEAFAVLDSNDHIRIEHEHPYGFDSIELPEEATRRLRDWLSWWLGEGPEPGATR